MSERLALALSPNLLFENADAYSKVTSGMRYAQDGQAWLRARSER